LARKGGSLIPACSRDKQACEWLMAPNWRKHPNPSVHIGRATRSNAQRAAYSSRLKAVKGA